MNFIPLLLILKDQRLKKMKEGIMGLLSHQFQTWEFSFISKLLFRHCHKYSIGLCLCVAMGAKR